MIILLILGIVVCIAGSYFFSSSEMGYSGCSETRIRESRSALYIVEHFDEALSTILIGNNLVNIASSSITSVLIMALADESKAWIGTVAVTVLIIIFGETIPKIISKKKPNTVAMKNAPVIRVLMVVFYPLVWLVVKLVDLLTRGMKEEEQDEDEQVEELQSIIETAEDEGVIDEDQSELLQNAIDFSETSASEVMTARVDMDAIDIDDPIEDIDAFISETRYSRLPVYEGSIDNIIGTLHLNAYYKAKIYGNDRIRDILSPACFVYKATKLPEALDALRTSRQQLAIVTDEYGGTAGLITLEDVLEEIVGEIWDENDIKEIEAVRVGANDFKVDGDMPLHDFFELIGRSEEEADEYESETVGGWIIEIAEHYPLKGEEIIFENLTITVLNTDDRRVEKVLVKVYNK